MKKLVTGCIWILLTLKISAQAINEAKVDSYRYANNFNKYLYSNPNSDSVVHYARKLALKKESFHLVRDLIHNSFAQEFRRKTITDPAKWKEAQKRKVFVETLLHKMYGDTTRALSETVQPIYRWTRIQENKNISETRSVTSEFINNQLKSGDLYANYTGRYGLLIHQEISAHEMLKPLADSHCSTCSADVLAGSSTGKVTTSRGSPVPGPNCSSSARIGPV